MATLVNNNPYDVQQAGTTSATPVTPTASTDQSAGLVGGTITNTALPTNEAMQNLQQYNPFGGLQVQSYAPQTREVDIPTETVQGQVESMLAKDSPLMQRARTIANQQMAQRGLVNSSMATGASTAAMIDSATPIATADANIFNTRSLANMAATNEANQFNVGQNNQMLTQGLSIAASKDLAIAQQRFQSAQAELDRALQQAMQDKSIQSQKDLQAADFNFKTAQNELDRAHQYAMAQLQANASMSAASMQVSAQATMQQASLAFQGTQAALDREQQMKMAQLAQSINQSNVSQNFAATIALNTSNTINGILSDPNIAPSDKTGAISNVINNSNTTLQWASTFYNTPLPTVTAPGGSQTILNPTPTTTSTSTSPSTTTATTPTPTAPPLPSYNYSGAGFVDTGI